MTPAWKVKLDLFFGSKVCFIKFLPFFPTLIVYVYYICGILNKTYWTWSVLSR